MRLTLRTMLAYLDDILEPADAADLGKKIEESRFATDLVYRIRNSTRRFRLGAPKVDGKGIGLDGNSVAEYLDNTLPPNEVADFEKVCLESDVHLAEVASCHQILTLVLGEPAEVPGALRDQIYRTGMPRDTAEESSSTAPPPECPPSASVLRAGDRPASAAPGRKSSLASLALTLACAFVLTFAGLHYLSRPNDRRLADASLKPGADAEPSTGAPNLAHQATDKTVADGASPGATETTPALPGVELKASESPPAVASPVGESVADSAAEAAGPANANPVNGGAAMRPASIAPGDEAVSPAAAADNNAAANAPTPPPAAAAAAAAATGAPSPSGAGSSPPTAPVGAAPVGGGPVGAAPVGTAPTEPGAAPAGPAFVGRFVSDDRQVLARFDNTAADGAGAWLRVEPMATLRSGESLLSLPTYRPMVLMGAAFKLTLMGETRLALEADPAAPLPRMALTHGRIIIAPTSDSEAKLPTKLGARNVDLLFADAASVAAVQVRYYLPPGGDPREPTRQTVIEVHAASGSVQWQEAGREPVTIQPGQVAASLDDGAPALFVADPALGWVLGNIEAIKLDQELVNVQLEREASRQIEQALTLDHWLDRSLQEAMASKPKRAAVESLAARAACALGVFPPILTVLNDAEHHTYWPGHLEYLRTVLMNNPEQVATFAQELLRQYPTAGETVFRILRGYAREEFESDGAAQLVAALGHPEMIVRVAAWDELRRITTKTRGYRPDQKPEQSRYWKAWQRALEDRDVRYVAVFRPLPERPPVAPAAAPAM